MSGVRNMDKCAGDSRESTTQGVCEPTQVRYPRKRREHWPFRFYEEKGKIYDNYTRPRNQKPNLDNVEDALL